MKKIRLRIPGSFGAALGAELDLPAHGKPHAWALFAHCFTCSRNLKAFHILFPKFRPCSVRFSSKSKSPPAGEHKDRKSTRLNSSHVKRSRMPSSA